APAACWTCVHVFPSSSEYQKMSPPVSGSPVSPRESTPIPDGAAIQIRWFGSLASTRIDGSPAWYAQPPGIGTGLVNVGFPLGARAAFAGAKSATATPTRRRKIRAPGIAGAIPSAAERQTLGARDRR